MEERHRKIHFSSILTWNNSCVVTEGPFISKELKNTDRLLSHKSYGHFSSQICISKNSILTSSPLNPRPVEFHSNTHSE